MKSIYNFAKGDYITRVAPAKSSGVGINVLTGQTFELCGDRSYMGDCLLFVGILNGCIYFKFTDETKIKVYGDKLYNVQLDIFEEGWSEWKNPNTLLDGNVETFMADMTQDEVNEKIKDALDNENYELAAKLRDLKK